MLRCWIYHLWSLTVITKVASSMNNLCWNHPISLSENTVHGGKMWCISRNTMVLPSYHAQNCSILRDTADGYSWAHIVQNEEFVHHGAKFIHAFKHPHVIPNQCCFSIIEIISYFLIIINTSDSFLKVFIFSIFELVFYINVDVFVFMTLCLSLYLYRYYFYFSCSLLCNFMASKSHIGK